MPREQRDSRVWLALSAALEELQASGEVRIETARENVIGHLNHELVSRGLLAPAALEARPGRERSLRASLREVGDVSALRSAAPPGRDPSAT